MVFPGLGDIYLGHRMLGTMEIIGAAIAWGFFGLAFLMPDGEMGGGLDFVSLGVVVTVVFCFVPLPDAWITRRMGLKGIYPASSD